MEGYETCKTQLSHYPHHLIRAGMCQKIILSILSFAHALQTPNGWTGNTFGFSSASIPNETDPLRGEFYASSTFVHFLPKCISRIKQNSYELAWINSDLHEFVRNFTERRVATGGSLALTACVCELIQNITWINMNHLEFIRINMS